jgi:hypothetical protein
MRHSSYRSFPLGETYPTRLVRIVVGVAAGGSAESLVPRGGQRLGILGFGLLVFVE